MHLPSTKDLDDISLGSWIKSVMDNLNEALGEAKRRGHRVELRPLYDGLSVYHVEWNVLLEEKHK